MEVRKEKIKVDGNKINFACLMENCPTSCCGPFGGVQNGLDSVTDTEFADITLTDHNSKKIITSGNAHLIELTERGYYRMKLNPDSSCSAFINGICSIHKVKPSICRAFPFYLDMFVGLCTVSGSCPGCGSDGWTDFDDLSEEITAVKEMYEFWLHVTQEKQFRQSTHV